MPHYKLFYKRLQEITHINFIRGRSGAVTKEKPVEKLFDIRQLKLLFPHCPIYQHCCYAWLGTMTSCECVCVWVWVCVCVCLYVLMCVCMCMCGCTCWEWVDPFYWPNTRITAWENIQSFFSTLAHISFLCLCERLPIITDPYKMAALCPTSWDGAVLSANRPLAALHALWIFISDRSGRWCLLKAGRRHHKPELQESVSDQIERSSSRSHGRLGGNQAQRDGYG